MEYKNVILYNFISSSTREFNEIIVDVTPEDLNRPDNFIYSRRKDKGDKSLEVYKFFINSLYVAITRSVQNLYWIESAYKHGIFKLLGTDKTQEKIQLEETTSNLGDWKKEADKLELQGKTEQAEEIRKNILKMGPVPWDICTADQFPRIRKEALEAEIHDRKAKHKKQFLFEYALVYQEDTVFGELKKRKFKRADRPYQQIPYINRIHYSDYNAKNTKSLESSIRRYGVDFRNPFNETPLMNAIKFSNLEAFHLLVNCGANDQLRDNYGRAALHQALVKSLAESKHEKEFLREVYPTLVQDAVSIKVCGKLIKLDAHLMEYFVFNMMIACFKKLIGDSLLYPSIGFSTRHFIHLFEGVPSTVLPERRKRRGYISSILSNNEINRDYQYNRYLFIRTIRGHYIFNPELEVRDGDEWINIYRLLNYDGDVRPSPLSAPVG